VVVLIVLVVALALMLACGAGVLWMLVTHRDDAVGGHQRLWNPLRRRL
jgi:hypothetical protein